MAYLTYVESRARTNRLHCTECNRKIKKGETAVFGLDDDRFMQEAFCDVCGATKDVYDEHPFSGEGLGQE